MKKAKVTKTARSRKTTKRTMTSRTHHTLVSGMHPNMFLLLVAGGAFIVISIIMLLR